MERGSALGGPTEIDLLVHRYLADASGDALAALRLAVTDALREAVDARLRILELERAASAGYRRRTGRRAGEGAGLSPEL